MKIRTRLNISIIFYLLIVCVVVFFTFLTSHQANKANVQLQVSGEISRGVFELNIMTSDYTTHQRERSKIQWQSKHESLQRSLSELDFQRPEEQLILSQIHDHHKFMRSLFSRLVEVHEKRDLHGNSVINNPLRLRLINSLLVESQEIVSDTAKLVSKSHAKVLLAQRRTFLFIIVLTLLLGGVMAANFLFIRRSILRPLFEFQKRTEIIGAGNLEISAGLETNDEVGQLTRAFNQMVKNLKTTMASRDELEKELREGEERYHVLFNSGSDAVFVNQPTAEGMPGKFIEVNDIACQKYGYTRDELLNLTPLDLSDPDGREDFSARKENLLAGIVPLRETVQVTKNGRKIPIEIHSHLFKLKDQPTVMSIARDITVRKQAEDQIKKSLKEKELLLSEIHHRVKNNMQVIISLLRLQAANISDKKYEAMLKESQVRIQSMALVHETLYQSQDFSNVDFKKYLKPLVNNLFRSYGIDTSRIKAKIEAEDVSIPIDSAVPCGLLINELVSNAFKYAFPGDRAGEIKIVLRSINENELELIVSDNGIGLPEDLDIKKPGSFGMELISILAEDQLNGKMELDRTAGTKYHIRFKKKMYRPRI